jgi:mannose-6-phosphate isomerase-like protein (cupin superfamily)
MSSAGIGSCQRVVAELGPQNRSTMSTLLGPACNLLAWPSVGARIEPMSRKAVDLAEKLASFSEHWSPKVVARMNDYEIKVVKIEGEFTWHSHVDTDELFFVLEGELTIQLRDDDVTVSPGQLFVVPRGLQHCPRADGLVHAMLIEPRGVANTGDAGGPLTAEYDDSLA